MRWFRGGRGPDNQQLQTRGSVCPERTQPSLSKSFIGIPKKLNEVRCAYAMLTVDDNGVVSRAHHTLRSGWLTDASDAWTGPNCAATAYAMSVLSALIPCTRNVQPNFLPNDKNKSKWMWPRCAKVESIATLRCTNSFIVRLLMEIARYSDCVVYNFVSHAMAFGCVARIYWVVLTACRTRGEQIKERIKTLINHVLRNLARDKKKNTKCTTDLRMAGT